MLPQFLPSRLPVVISRSAESAGALKAKQRGFIMNPYRFGPSSAAGLLDAYTTNLWGGWGIKRLIAEAAYTGPALRVRRSSDDAEMDVYFTAGAQTLDSGSITAWSGSDSVYVKTLYDQTGNSRDFTQATTTKQPRIVNAGAYDGKLVFDGTDDGLATVASPATTGVTASIKRRYRRSGTNDMLLHAYTTSTNSWFHYRPSTNDSHSYGTQGATSEFVAYSGTTVVGSDHVTGLLFDRTQGSTSARKRCWIDASELSVASSSSTTITGSFVSQAMGLGMHVSNTLPAAVDVFHLAVWSAALTPTDIVAINALMA